MEPPEHFVRETIEPRRVTPEDRLTEMLREFTRSIPGVEIVVVGDPAGLPVASLARGGNTLAATASATLLVSAARSVASNMDLPPLESIVLDGPGYKVVVQSLRHGFTLIAVLPGDANLGMARLLAARMSEEITEILDLMR